MIQSGFKQENIEQKIPPQLMNENYSNDVILSRVNRRVLPTGSGSDIAPNTDVNFDLKTSREWNDAATSYLHAKITVDACANGADAATAPIFKIGGAQNLIKSYNIVSKGQSLENSTDSGNLALQHWNSLQTRLFEPLEKNSTVSQIQKGTWSVLGDNFMTTDGRINNNKVVYDVCIPLSDVIQFFKLKRSYLPLFAIPLNLRLTLNDPSRVFFNPSASVNKTAVGNYTVSELYITSDFLEMDDAVNKMFMDTVLKSNVTFTYPSVYLVQGNIGTDKTINAKQSLNASNVQSAFVSITDNTLGIDDFYPTCTIPSLYDTNTLKGVNFNMYIDSVPVLSQYCNTPSEHLSELVKCCKNQRQQYLESTPNISAKGFLNGVITNAVDAKLQDVACNTIGFNLSRQLENESMSGVDLTSVAGNCTFDIQGLSAGADNKQYILIFSLIKQLVLEKEMLKVIN